MIPKGGVEWKLLQFCTRDITGSNLVLGPAFLTKGFLCFPQFLQTDATEVLQMTLLLPSISLLSLPVVRHSSV
jgi:hypothetical protein